MEKPFSLLAVIRALEISSPKDSIKLVCFYEFLTIFDKFINFKFLITGFTVFAGCLFSEGADAKKLKESNPNIRILQLDVTNREQVENAVKEIEKSQLPLWSIVNNAGIGVGFYFDWGNDVDEHRKVMEVNTFGLMRVTKNCMGLLRKSSGRIVNVTSTAGKLLLIFFCQK